MSQTFDKIDFNQLRTLYLLLEERSVTRAADRLFVTQSAMSKTLARLRELFGDPLLVRHGSSLVLTPLAEQLRVPLQRIVASAESCFDLTPFDPASAKDCIKIAAPEQFALLTVPELLARLRLKAPGLFLEAQHLTDDFTNCLASGKADFAILRAPPDSVEFTSQAIYSARPVCWCRNDHPLLKKQGVSHADILSYPLIRMKTQFLPEETAVVRHEAVVAGLQSEIVLETEHMIVAMVSLIRSDALMIVPNLPLWLSTITSDLISAIPISHISAFDALNLKLYLVQHQRTASSQLHQWVSSEIAGIFEHEKL